MAYTYQKAENHIQTGKFNAVASPNQTLIDYGDHFAAKIGTSYAGSLLNKITDELIDRQNGYSSSKYSGKLTNYELKKLGDYCKVLGRINPFGQVSSKLIAAIKANQQWDAAKVDSTLKDLNQAYQDAEAWKWVGKYDIKNFIDAISNGTLTSIEQNVAAIIIKCAILLCKSVTDKLATTRNLQVKTCRISYGGPIDDIKVLFTLDNNANNEFRIISALEHITANDAKIIGENGLIGLVDYTFAANDPLTINGTTYCPTNFKDLYKIIKNA